VTDDKLRDTIVNSDDLILYDEAKLCLKANANRAAYIISWIAAAEGLLGKLREMAVLHAALGEFVGNFEAAQQSGTARDSDLIAKAFEIGLISKPERIELDAMRELRNQYGHPTATAPTHTSAEHALHTAVSAVLAKPPLIMHGAAKDLAARASTDRHLVPQDEEAIDAFMTTRAAVMHEAARPVFIRGLLNGASEQLRDVNGELLAERCLRMAVIALQEWSDPLVPPRWNIDKMQQRFPAVAADVFSDPVVWRLVQAEDQDRILSRCLDHTVGAEFTTAPGRLLARADRLDATEGLLTAAQQARVREVLESEDPWRVLSSGVRLENVARAVIHALASSLFKIAGEGVNVFRAIRRDDLGQLDKDLQRELGTTLAYAANNNTFAAINEVETMAADPDIWPADLRAGVVVGGLVGKSFPLMHPRTSKAALRLALADTEGNFAQDAIDALNLESRDILPYALPEVRSILDNEDPTPAVAKLEAFLDRIEPDEVADE
jgi:hypothetical protein